MTDTLWTNVKLDLKVQVWIKTTSVDWNKEETSIILPASHKLLVLMNV